MGSISLPTMAIIAGIGTAATAGVAAYESHEQGVATANADKRKARIEADSETQKQIGMRQNMLRALATQNAQAGVGGGSLNKANTMRQLTQAQNDIMVSKSNSSAQVSLLDQAASNAEAAGNIGAAGDILGGATKYAGMGGMNGG